MGKPNTYLQLRQAQQRIATLEHELYYAKGFTMQQCMDIAMIALHQEFGFGPVYQDRFEKAFRQAFVDYAELCVEDSKDDDDIDYTKAVMDRALRAARGENILPFEQRYAEENLYFRDGRDAWKEGSVNA